MVLTSSKGAGARGRGDRLAMALLLALALAWGGWFIERTSFTVGGTRWCVIFDDALISMAYARNLVEGRGLTWAREGPPVEGFTTPLWTLAMVPAELLPVERPLRPLAVQLLSLGLLALHLVLVRRLVRRWFSPDGEGSWWPAVLLTAGYYPLVYWALMGMETALQALLAGAAVHLAYEIVEERRDRAVALGAVLALAYLARMDMLLVAAGVVGWIAIHGGFRRSERRSWLVGAAIVLAAAGGWQLFRLLYFGDPLPNTYYLKLTGVPLDVRLGRGLAMYGAFLRANAAALLLLGAAIAPRLRERRFQLPVLLFVLASAYSVWVGGDAWDQNELIRANRFVAFLVPLLFVLFNGGVNRVRAATVWTRPAGGSRLARAAASALGPAALSAGATLALLVFANGLWLAPNAALQRRAVVFADRPMMVGSHAQVIERLLALERKVAPDARVAVFWAGIPGYFSDWRLVDMYGYSDRHVARLPANLPAGAAGARAYTPGHAKWSYLYVLRERPPDAFFQAWYINPPRGPALLAAHGYVLDGDFWVRAGSPYLLPAEAPGG